MEVQGYTSTLYREHIAAGKLTGTRCTNCFTVFLPPRPYCWRCGGTEMDLVEFKGGGRVEAFSDVHFPGLELQAAGYGRERPVCAAIVRLDEGPAISAQIVGEDRISTPGVKIGERVRLDFVHRGEGEEQQVYPVFVPEKAVR